MSNSAKGLTLVEVIVSLALIVIILTAAAATIVNSQFLSSLARHKSQAAYAAQQILEQQRRLPFPNITSVPTAPVVLDTNGVYNTTVGAFMGAAVITVTNIDQYRKKVQVEVNWPQRGIMGKQITMREFFATTIANETQLN